MGSITFLTIALLLLSNQQVSAHSAPQQASLSTLGTEDTKIERDKPKEDKSNQEESSLDFSDTGRPGQQTAGESRGICENFDERIRAVVPASHTGKTVSGHPSFWVHFPAAAKNISHVEFVIQNEDREDIWRSQSTIDQDIDVGYQQFSLPKTESPLEINQWYRWYVKVYCQPNTASTQYVQGWIERIPLTSKLYLELQQESQASHKTYSSYLIWYDAIDQLLQEYQRQPSNLVLEQDWQNLIEAKGVELHTLPNVGAIYEAVK